MNIPDEIDRVTLKIFEESNRYKESLENSEPFDLRRDILERMRALQKELEILQAQLKN